MSTATWPHRSPWTNGSAGSKEGTTRQISVCRKSSSAGSCVVKDRRKYILDLLLGEYRVDNMHNLDEVALFYRVLPTKTFATKETHIKGLKQQTERIAVLFSAKVSGHMRLVCNLPAGTGVRLGFCHWSMLLPSFSFRRSPSLSALSRA